MYPSPTM